MGKNKKINIVPYIIIILVLLTTILIIWGVSTNWTFVSNSQTLPNKEQFSGFDSIKTLIIDPVVDYVKYDLVGDAHEASGSKDARTKEIADHTQEHLPAVVDYHYQNIDDALAKADDDLEGLVQCGGKDISSSMARWFSFGKTAPKDENNCQYAVESRYRNHTMKKNKSGDVSAHLWPEIDDTNVRLDSANYNKFSDRDLWCYYQIKNKQAGWGALAVTTEVFSIFYGGAFMKVYRIGSKKLFTFVTKKIGPYITKLATLMKSMKISRLTSFANKVKENFGTMMKRLSTTSATKPISMKPTSYQLMKTQLEGINSGIYKAGSEVAENMKNFAQSIGIASRYLLLGIMKKAWAYRRVLINTYKFGHKYPILMFRPERYARQDTTGKWTYTDARFNDTQNYAEEYQECVNSFTSGNEIKQTKYGFRKNGANTHPIGFVQGGPLADVSVKNIYAVPQKEIYLFSPDNYMGNNPFILDTDVSVSENTVLQDYFDINDLNFDPLVVNNYKKLTDYVTNVVNNINPIYLDYFGGGVYYDASARKLVTDSRGGTNKNANYLYVIRTKKNGKHYFLQNGLNTEEKHKKFEKKTRNLEYTGSVTWTPEPPTQNIWIEGPKNCSLEFAVSNQLLWVIRLTAIDTEIGNTISIMAWSQQAKAGNTGSDIWQSSLSVLFGDFRDIENRLREANNDTKWRTPYFTSASLPFVQMYNQHFNPNDSWGIADKNQLVKLLKEYVKMQVDELGYISKNDYLLQTCSSSTDNTWQNLTECTNDKQYQYLPINKTKYDQTLAKDSLKCIENDNMANIDIVENQSGNNKGKTCDKNYVCKEPIFRKTISCAPGEEKDCEFTWKDVGDCSSECGAGLQTQQKEIIQPRTGLEKTACYDFEEKKNGQSIKPSEVQKTINGKTLRECQFEAEKTGSKYFSYNSGNSTCKILKPAKNQAPSFINATGYINYERQNLGDRKIDCTRPACPSPPAEQISISPSSTSSGSQSSQGKGVDNSSSMEPVKFDPICFPKSATIQLQNGSSITMDKLQIGDLVKTKNGFSPIYMFIHYLPNVDSEFVHINNQLKISKNHFIAVNDKSNYIRSEKIKLGDVIFINGLPEKVTSKKDVTDTGLYAPATLDGNLIVDNVLVSCYATYKGDHSFTLPFFGEILNGNTVVCMGHTPLRLMNRFYSIMNSTKYNKPEQYGYHDYTVFLLNTFPRNLEGNYQLLNPFVFLGGILLMFLYVIDTMAAFCFTQYKKRKTE